MSVTIWGPIATEDGTTWWIDDIVHTAPGGQLLVERRNRFADLPAAEFSTVQPDHISVDLNHRGVELGQVVYLERDQTLTAVAVLDDLEPDDLDSFGPCKLSTLTAHDRVTGDVELRSCAIVKAAEAAAVGLAPIQWIPGDIRRNALYHVPIGEIQPILRRAEQHCHRRGRYDPLRIQRPPPKIEHASGDGGELVLADGEPIGVVAPEHRRQYRVIDGQWAELEIRPARILSVAGRPVRH